MSWSVLNHSDLAILREAALNLMRVDIQSGKYRPTGDPLLVAIVKIDRILEDAPAPVEGAA